SHAAGGTTTTVQRERILDIERAAIRAVEQQQLVAAGQRRQQVPRMLERDVCVRVSRVELLVGIAETLPELEFVGDVGGRRLEGWQNLQQLPGREYVHQQRGLGLDPRV